MGSNFVIPNKESSWRVTCRPDVHTHPRPPPSSASHLPRPSKSSTSLPPPPILPLPPTARPPELDCRGGPALLPSSSSSAPPSLPPSVRTTRRACLCPAAFLCFCVLGSTALTPFMLAASRPFLAVVRFSRRAYGWLVPTALFICSSLVNPCPFHDDEILHLVVCDNAFRAYWR
jgi:hypothetical protein